MTSQPPVMVLPMQRSGSVAGCHGDAFTRLGKLVAAPVRRVGVQLADQFDDIAVRIGDIPLLDVVSPDTGTACNSHIAFGQSCEDRLEIAHAKGEMHGVPRLELVGRPLLAKLRSPAGFGLDYDVDLSGTEPEVGPRKCEVGRAGNLLHP